MEPTRKVLRLLPLLVGTFVLVGCGGGGASSASTKSGRAAVLLSIAWPARARATATPVESVSVSVKVNGTEAERTIFNRPASDSAMGTDYTFTDLPSGSLTTSLTSYTQASAAGDIVETRQATGTLQSGKTLAQSAAFTASDSGLTLTIGKQTDTGSLAVGVH